MVHGAQHLTYNVAAFSVRNLPIFGVWRWHMRTGASISFRCLHFRSRLLFVLLKFLIFAVYLTFFETWLDDTAHRHASPNRSQSTVCSSTWKNVFEFFFDELGAWQELAWAVCMTPFVCFVIWLQNKFLFALVLAWMCTCAFNTCRILSTSLDAIRRMLECCHISQRLAQ